MNGYSIFLMIELARLARVIRDGLEYDTVWEQGESLYEDFKESEFNKDTEPEYECMEKFLEKVWLDSKKPSILLQVGMRVKIKNDAKNFGIEAGAIKTITKQLPDFNEKRAFELDNKEGIWLIQDFAFCIDSQTSDMC